MKQKQNKSMPQKLFRFEVDQSIRVEVLTDDTIVGLANEESFFTIKLSARNKRRLYEHFRYLGQPKKFAPKIFTALIILSVSQSKCSIKELLIDIEYPGYELFITDLLKSFFPDLLVYFGVIGKKSPALYVAYGVHKGKREADKICKLEEIIKVL